MMFRVIAGCCTVVALGVTGCTTLVDGTASRAAGSETADGVDVALLDAGPYPTAPLPAFGLAGNEVAGALLEAARLANYVVLPTDIDQTLTLDPAGEGGYTLKDPAALDLLLAPPLDAPGRPYVDAAANHGYITGFGSRRAAADTADDTELINAVLEFGDPVSAKAAATEMAEYDKAWPATPSISLAIPGNPDTAAYTVELWRARNETRAYTAYGQYVLIQLVEAETPERTTGLIADTLAAQRPLLDDYTPTDPAELTQLPFDPTGLLTRTLPVQDYLTTMEGRVREPAAALHFEPEPRAARTLFDEVGMVAVATSEAQVYESSLPDGGNRFVETASEWPVDHWGFEPADGVAGMPNSRCFGQVVAPSESGFRRQLYMCFGSAGQYGFRVMAAQEPDAHQMLAAQYLMLTAP